MTDIILRSLKDKMREIREKHRQAIEEKEAALALLNDELTEVDSRIKKLEFHNVALQSTERCTRDSAAESVKIGSKT